MDICSMVMKVVSGRWEVGEIMQDVDPGGKGVLMEDVSGGRAIPLLGFTLGLFCTSCVNHIREGAVRNGVSKDVKKNHKLLSTHPSKRKAIR